MQEKMVTLSEVKSRFPEGSILCNASSTGSDYSKDPYVLKHDNIIMHSDRVAVRKDTGTGEIAGYLYIESTNSWATHRGKVEKGSCSIGTTEIRAFLKKFKVGDEMVPMGGGGDQNSGMPTVKVTSKLLRQGEMLANGYELWFVGEHDHYGYMIHKQPGESAVYPLLKGERFLEPFPSNKKNSQGFMYITPENIDRIPDGSLVLEVTSDGSRTDSKPIAFYRRNLVKNGEYAWLLDGNGYLYNKTDTDPESSPNVFSGHACGSLVTCPPDGNKYPPGRKDYLIYSRIQTLKRGNWIKTAAKHGSVEVEDPPTKPSTRVKTGPTIIDGVNVPLILRSKKKV